MSIPERPLFNSIHIYIYIYTYIKYAILFFHIYIKHPLFEALFDVKSNSFKISN